MRCFHADSTVTLAPGFQMFLSHCLLASSFISLISHWNVSTSRWHYTAWCTFIFLLFVWCKLIFYFPVDLQTSLPNGFMEICKHNHSLLSSKCACLKDFSVDVSGWCSHLHKRDHVHFLIFRMVGELCKCISALWEHSEITLTQRWLRPWFSYSLSIQSISFRNSFLCEKNKEHGIIQEKKIK